MLTIQRASRDERFHKLRFLLVERLFLPSIFLPLIFLPSPAPIPGRKWQENERQEYEAGELWLLLRIEQGYERDIVVVQVDPLDCCKFRVVEETAQGVFHDFDVRSRC